ncbi:HCP-like protein [Hymenopellis radicata]|nr:HCP-like protein [Hymenopellis radicata]
MSPPTPPRSDSPSPLDAESPPSVPTLSLEIPIPSILQPGQPASPSLRSPSSPSSPSKAVADIPTVSSLELSYQADVEPETQIAWCRDVVYLLGRHTSLDPDAGPTKLTDASLLALVQTAVEIFDALAASCPEAQYLRATIAASGAVPGIVQHNRQQAFRDFEASAKAGFHKAWFNLGREYETCGDVGHARDCFERGVAFGVNECLYRMGVAHLVGQLDLPQNIPSGLALLARAATNPTLYTPQPAYAYALLLLGESGLANIPASSFNVILPPSTSALDEAKVHLERAAFFHYPPAQYKLALAYEFAQYPWPYDPLMSVEWYSKSGTMEAEMALSKWFLCGAEGAFEKDEGLAWVFAEKAADKGLVNAEFAMGYYCEVGVAGKKDLDKAISWYNKAATHGSDEAKGRLQALNLPTPSVLTRSEHETLTGEKLVRKRTTAKMVSDARGATTTRRPSRRVLENIRKETISEGVYPMTPPKTPSPPPASPTLLAAPQMPGRKRYSLVDPGFNSAGEAPARSPSPCPPGRRTRRRRYEPPPRKSSAPQTFAEMGIGSTTMTAPDSDKSDCVVM